MSSKKESVSQLEGDHIKKIESEERHNPESPLKKESILEQLENEQSNLKNQYKDQNLLELSASDRSIKELKSESKKSEPQVNYRSSYRVEEPTPRRNVFSSSVSPNDL